MRRKVLSYALVMGFGIYIVKILSSNIAICTIIFVALLVALFAKNACKGLLAFFIVGIVIMLGTNYHMQTDLAKVNIESKEHYKAIVQSVTEDEYLKIVCTIVEINNEPAKIQYNTLITSPLDEKSSSYISGSTITFDTKLEIPSTSRNPRSFNYNIYLKTKKILTIGFTNHIAIGKSEPSIFHMVNNYTKDIKGKFLENFNENSQSQSLIRGIVFGDSRKISEENLKIFRENGTAHILAVSGLHVGMLYGIFLKIIGINSKVKMALFLVILTIFVAFSSWSISAIRAGFMIVIGIVAKITHRKYDLQTSAAVTSIIFLAYNPYLLFSMSFLLSFLAIFSIGIIGKFLNKILGLGRSIAMMISIQLGLIPVIAYTFNYISINTIIANIPIVFMLSILMPLGIVSLLMTVVGLNFLPVYFVMESLSNMLIWINERLYCEGKFLFEIATKEETLVIFIYVIMFLVCTEEFYILSKRKERKKQLLIVVTIIPLFICLFNINRCDFDSCDAVFLDVGQGDAIHLRLNNKQHILIDGGGNIGYNIGTEVLKPYFMSNGVSGIQGAMITHMHTDHYLGAKELGEVYPIGSYYLELERGNVIDFGKGDKIEVLWPINKVNQNLEEEFDENTNTSVLKITINQATILITGDITAQGEKEIVNYYKDTDVLKSDILKVSHHGSKYSSTDEFLDEVNPKIAIIQVGENNYYGHPHEETIYKLEERKIPIYRNDYHGAVGIEITEGKINICTMIK